MSIVGVDEVDGDKDFMAFEVEVENWEEITDTDTVAVSINPTVVKEILLPFLLLCPWGFYRLLGLEHCKGPLRSICMRMNLAH